MQVLFSTETFAMGVNAPARTVRISSYLLIAFHANFLSAYANCFIHLEFMILVILSRVSLAIVHRALCVIELSILVISS